MVAATRDRFLSRLTPLWSRRIGSEGVGASLLWFLKIVARKLELVNGKLGVFSP
jgi:hypothetical protein